MNSRRLFQQLQIVITRLLLLVCGISPAIATDDLTSRLAADPSQSGRCSALLRAYSDLLNKEPQLVSTTELQQMIETGNIFTLADGGASTKELLRGSLLQLKAAAHENIEDFEAFRRLVISQLKDHLDERMQSDRSQFENQEASATVSSIHRSFEFPVRIPNRYWDPKISQNGRVALVGSDGRSNTTKTRHWVIHLAKNQPPSHQSIYEINTPGTFPVSLHYLSPSGSKAFLYFSTWGESGRAKRILVFDTVDPSAPLYEFGATLYSNDAFALSTDENWVVWMRRSEMFEARNLNALDKTIRLPVSREYIKHKPPIFVGPRATRPLNLIISATGRFAAADWIRNRSRNFSFVWDVQGKKIIKASSSSVGMWHITSLAFSPDETKLVTSTRSGTDHGTIKIHILDLVNHTSTELVNRENADTQIFEKFFAASFSDDSKQLGIFYSDRKHGNTELMDIWDTTTGKTITSKPISRTARSTSIRNFPQALLRFSADQKSLIVTTSSVAQNPDFQTIMLQEYLIASGNIEKEEVISIPRIPGTFSLNASVFVQKGLGDQGNFVHAYWFDEGMEFGQ